MEEAADGRAQYFFVGTPTGSLGSPDACSLDDVAAAGPVEEEERREQGAGPPLLLQSPLRVLRLGLAPTPQRRRPTEAPPDTWQHATDETPERLVPPDGDVAAGGPSPGPGPSRPPGPSLTPSRPGLEVRSAAPTAAAGTAGPAPKPVSAPPPAAVRLPPPQPPLPAVAPRRLPATQSLGAAAAAPWGVVAGPDPAPPGALRPAALEEPRTSLPRDQGGPWWSQPALTGRRETWPQQRRWRRPPSGGPEEEGPVDGQPGLVQRVWKAVPAPGAAAGRRRRRQRRRGRSQGGATAALGGGEV